MQDDRVFRMTEHCCRTCLGPILATDTTFVCAVCGVEAEDSPEPICGCGIRPRDIGDRDGHFRCTLNPARSPAHPARIVIAFAGDSSPGEASQGGSGLLQ